MVALEAGRQQAARSTFQSFISFCSIQRPQNASEDFLKPLFILLITHLTPGGGVPVETRLKITRHLCLWPGGHGSAVKRSKGPLIPHVKTLDFS